MLMLNKLPELFAKVELHDWHRFFLNALIVEFILLLLCLAGIWATNGIVGLLLGGTHDVVKETGLIVIGKAIFLAELTVILLVCLMIVVTSFRMVKFELVGCSFPDCPRRSSDKKNDNKEEKK